MKRFLKRNKQKFIALFIVFVMVFNSCPEPFYNNPGDSIPDLNPSDLNPFAFFVDCDGNFSEEDLGRTVIMADENPLDVVFYSDDASTYQHVGINFDDKSIIFFFEENQYFPTSMVLQDFEETINGYFSSYNHITQTYNLILVQDNEEEILSNIFLSKDIFSQYIDDAELTLSQNLRMRNLFIVTNIYMSLDDHIASKETLEVARKIFRKIVSKVVSYIPQNNPIVKIAVNSVLVVAGIADVGIKIYCGNYWGAIASGAFLIYDTYNLINSINELHGDTSTVHAPGVPIVSVSSISLNKTSSNLVIGTTEDLNFTINPSNATNKAVRWSSSNTAVATVGINGAVNGRSLGSTTITVTTVDGNRTASCTVTVIPVPVTGVTLNKSTTSMLIGASETFSATIMPTNAANKNVTWSSSNNAVATVSTNGTVTGVSVGTSTITVTTTDGGYTASCIVTVNPVLVDGVILDKYSLNLGIGDTVVLIHTITPANATNKNVSWSSSNPAVATVSSNGTVTGHGVGSSIITVTTADGGKTAACTVTVTVNSLLFYWVDEHNNLVTSGATTVTRGETLTITANAAGYNVIQWHLNGVNTGQSGNTYNFSSMLTGNHTVGLFVEKDGKLFNTNIAITVQ